MYIHTRTRQVTNVNLQVAVRGLWLIGRIITHSTNRKPPVRSYLAMIGKLQVWKWKTIATLIGLTAGCSFTLTSCWICFWPIKIVSLLAYKKVVLYFKGILRSGNSYHLYQPTITFQRRLVHECKSNQWFENTIRNDWSNWWFDLSLGHILLGLLGTRKNQKRWSHFQSAW